VFYSHESCKLRLESDLNVRAVWGCASAYLDCIFICFVVIINKDLYRADETILIHTVYIAGLNTDKSRLSYQNIHIKILARSTLITSSIHAYQRHRASMSTKVSVLKIVELGVQRRVDSACVINISGIGIGNSVGVPELANSPQVQRIRYPKRNNKEHPQPNSRPHVRLITAVAANVVDGGAVDAHIGT
jgi:hypothetical protein